MLRLGSFLLFVSFLLSCKPNLKTTIVQKGDADFTKLVAVGDDYLSGITNGALGADGQEASIPNLIAQQCKTYFNSSDFNQPLLPGTFGFGVSLDAQHATHYFTPFQLLHTTDCTGADQLLPVRNELEATNTALTEARNPIFVAGGFNNFAVPLAKAADLSSALFSSTAEIAAGGNPFYARFAENPQQSTIMHEASAANASFFFLHIGMNDIYQYAMNGAADGVPTLASDFQLSLDKIIDSLSANGAKGVIANIPSLEDLPYFTTISSQGLVLDQQKADLLIQVFGGQMIFTTGANGFVMYDPGSAFGYRKMLPEEKLLLNVNPDSLKCFGLGSLYPLRSVYVLDTAEIRKINGIIDQYNTIINIETQLHDGLALVDLNSYFKEIRNGKIINGISVNTDFVTGNFFSLDGFHPTKLGYALITNEFIRSINTRYSSSIPTVSISGADTIVLP